MPLPPLREELALHPGPVLPDGQPSWTLHDPVRNQFFRLDWQTFEILSRWPLNDAQAIVDSISGQTTLHPSLEDIGVVAEFLAENQLVQILSPDSATHLAGKLGKLRSSWGKWLLHHYLFFRIPLVKPDRWLSRNVDRVSWFYSPSFLRLTCIVLVFGLIQVYRDWERFSASLVDTLSWGGMLGIGITLVGVKVAHELGHAFTAKRYGCRVPTMGVAFLVLWPVAYTDTNEVWKLADRTRRLAVAASGVATELVIAVWATLAWALLPEGGPKSVAFMLATTTWITTVLLNSSPFLRFDGYFLLSDWLDLPNLHARAFALARWALRERLFDLGDPPPEIFPPRRRRGLILFAYATWIYRLVLFIGIAILVYHFFTKVLGVLLFAVELGWFVILPVWRELSVWKKRWPAIRSRPRARRTAQWALVVTVLFIIPWPTRISAKSLLRAAETYPIHAPAGAQVVELPWPEGSFVSAGQPVLHLASPELFLRLSMASAKLEKFRWQAAAAGLDTGQRQNLQLLEQERTAAESELAGIRLELETYQPRAPFDGRLHDLDPELKPGAWVSRHERLAVLVREGKWQVETYLDGEAVRRVAVGDSARFFADGLEGPFLPMTVSAVDRDATRVLTDGVLATRSGGSVTIREKNGQLVPEGEVYRVTFSVEARPQSLSGHQWRGTAVIHGSWEAPGARFLRAALALVWREAGF